MGLFFISTLAADKQNKLLLKQVYWKVNELIGLRNVKKPVNYYERYDVGIRINAFKMWSQRLAVQVSDTTMYN
jgi:hypothetical protein